MISNKKTDGGICKELKQGAFVTDTANNRLRISLKVRKHVAALAVRQTGVMYLW